MKEYKVIMPKLGLRNRYQKLEDLLNQYAREGWNLKHLGEGWTNIVLERDKNR
ncbi:hypothetical protein SAMN04489761_1665 [Tenacibaculum sp. MAR_2009_124]|uniref:DUF4177 domain-containing protein n=1 Tax=Tenacibaculum sp. MAR_2009_124 TaxID=1250059 RepID=UPI0008942219|nr:DUF4177 domain-containing protein [Tenacibaculum sp. MAR_2009_124]SEB75374.1 hypothetical protein SAMN04489761_1665 [Tenacibaculum sp. MAR_2009_124]